ncbi:hypothetical protein RFI_36885, partial [Reticulomyxa filosa]
EILAPGGSLTTTSLFGLSTSEYPPHDIFSKGKCLLNVYVSLATTNFNLLEAKNKKTQQTAKTAYSLSAIFGIVKDNNNICTQSNINSSKVESSFFVIKKNTTTSSLSDQAVGNSGASNNASIKSKSEITKVLCIKCDGIGDKTVPLGDIMSMVHAFYDCGCSNATNKKPSCIVDTYMSSTGNGIFVEFMDIHAAVRVFKVFRERKKMNNLPVFQGSVLEIRRCNRSSIRKKKTDNGHMGHGSAGENEAVSGCLNSGTNGTSSGNGNANTTPLTYSPNMDTPTRTPGEGGSGSKVANNSFAPLGFVCNMSSDKSDHNEVLPQLLRDKTVILPHEISDIRPDISTENDHQKSEPQQQQYQRPSIKNVGKSKLTTDETCLPLLNWMNRSRSEALGSLDSKKDFAMTLPDEIAILLQNTLGQFAKDIQFKDLFLEIRCKKSDYDSIGLMDYIQIRNANSSDKATIKTETNTKTNNDHDHDHDHDHDNDHDHDHDHDNTHNNSNSTANETMENNSIHTEGISLSLKLGINNGKKSDKSNGLTGEVTNPVNHPLLSTFAGNTNTIIANNDAGVTKLVSSSSSITQKPSLSFRANGGQFFFFFFFYIYVYINMFAS